LRHHLRIEISDRPQFEWLGVQHLVFLNAAIRRDDLRCFLDIHAINPDAERILLPYMCDETGEVLTGLAINCTFGDVPRGAYSIVDQIACYPTIYLGFTHLPVFSEFDHEEAYDGHDIEDLTLYYVKYDGPRTKATNILLPNDITLLYGMQVPCGLSIEIIKFIRLASSRTRGET
jgi:hypothetical protein